MVGSFRPVGETGNSRIHRIRARDGGDRTGAGIANATVALLPLTTSSGPVRTTISSRTGAFTVNSVPAGRYEVCARPATAAYADSFLWGTHRIIANVPAPAGAQPIVILLKKASLLKVRPNDSATFLQPLPTEKFPPHLVVGVWGRRFLAAREMKKDSTGIDYELAVPADTALSFRPYGQKVRLQLGGTGAGSSPVPPKVTPPCSSLIRKSPRLRPLLSRQRGGFREPRPVQGCERLMPILRIFTIPLVTSALILWGQVPVPPPPRTMPAPSILPTAA